MFKKLLFTLGILPMTALAFQVGAWVGGPGQYPQPTQENVQAFQDLQGTHVDLISYFALFDMNDWNATEEYANVAKNNGSTLVVTWMANGYNAQDLVNGKADNYIREYAKGVKGFGDEIWLRPLHEANGNNRTLFAYRLWIGEGCIILQEPFRDAGTCHSGGEGY